MTARGWAWLIAWYVLIVGAFLVGHMIRNGGHF
jgi:hypothetical protein